MQMVDHANTGFKRIRADRPRGADNFRRRLAMRTVALLLVLAGLLAVAGQVVATQAGPRIVHQTYPQPGPPPSTQ